MHPLSAAPIGLFDSGVGGLSILKAVRSHLPAESLIYVADQARVPYGGRPVEQVREFSTQITEWLLAQGCKLIVVACNTASAAALYGLRERWPAVPFVGMEPAVKPAATLSRTGAVGVLATRGTLSGSLYQNVLARFAHGVQVISVAAPVLVEAVEHDRLNDPDVRKQLEQDLAALAAANADQLVLACTHFTFASDLIQAVVGPQVNLIDPAPAIARQVERLLTAHNSLATTGTGSVAYYTTGDPTRFAQQISSLLGETAPIAQQLVLPEQQKSG